MDQMNTRAKALADFRSQVTKLLHEREREWELSRRLVEPTRAPSTMKRLVEEAGRVDIPAEIREAITAALKSGEASRLQDLPGPRLKELTGLPPTKAVRALCVWFDLIETTASSPWPAPALRSDEIAAFVRDHANPFDLLARSDVASVLDIGSGDLSFANELAEQYLPILQGRGTPLVLHCLDRLHPESRLGGPLHPERQRLEALRARPGLAFQFFSDQDMFALEPLERAGKLAPRYAIATCWAPATPTFAYEPARLSQELIAQELHRTKGDFRRTHFSGEPALEVRHGERSLLFPPWKFDIRGPLALLDLLARRGCLCVIGAVDTQVFWEVLAQLLEEPRFRPSQVLFTPENIPAVFAEVFEDLSRLPVGDDVDLSVCAPLRRTIPRVLPVDRRQNSQYRFCSVRIRRGAVFPGIPASSTARRFRDMAEETPPWMLTLVPE